ncbi:MAG: 2-(3-amino-3-carboxypropyl)histidine synthase subunit [Nanoarchaeota archaeon]|nr:2-(3-amino-3-carboxypropyl)histidine synthase subunit [Nanoarchaeota archaeon]
MKTIFIPAKAKLNIPESKLKIFLEKLPKNLVIAYSIQYKDFALRLKKILEKNHRILKTVQVLGCSKPNLPKNTQAILLVSDGKFHALSLNYETKIPVYIINSTLERVSNQNIQEFGKKQKASYLNFLNSEKIGVIISTKPGQQNLKKAIDLKRKLKNKSAYLFISNNIDNQEFQNFGLKAWINTACPRLDMNDASIINIDKLNYD